MAYAFWSNSDKLFALHSPILGHNLTHFYIGMSFKKDVGVVKAKQLHAFNSEQPVH